MSSASTTPPLAHCDHICCLECGYDLSGTIEDRCPECGLQQARSKLAQWSTQAAQPVPFGCIPPASGRRPLWFASLFMPSELGKRLPPFPDSSEIRVHVWVMRGIALLVFLLFIVASARHGDGAVVFIGAAVGMLVGAIVCEALAAGVLASCVQVRPPSTRAVWWHLARCHATFLPLSAVYISLSLLTRFVRYFAARQLGHGFWASVLPITPVPTLIWWWVNLTRSLYARSVPGPGQLLAAALLPIAAGAALTIGVLSGFIVGFALATGCRF